MNKLLFLPLLLLLLCTGCGEEKPDDTYEYEKEKVLSFSAKKMLVYEDRIEVYFSRNALSDAETVICFDEDFDEIDADADFDVDDDVLTVYSDDPEDISGLKIIIDNHYEYWSIRYLDSDQPAILQYTWADDLGYMCEGDEKAYYTSDEKAAQEKRIQENLARRDAAMAKIAGTWENETGTIRMKIYLEDDPIIEIYTLSDGTWTLSQDIIADWAGEDSSYDPEITNIYIEEGVGFSCMYDFKLYNNLTECECDLIDGRLKKVEE